MSSSDHFPRLTLIDLQEQVPGNATEDFTEQAEFPRLTSSREQSRSPEEAHRAGLEEGEQRGRAAALEELEPVLEELRSLSRSMIQIREERLNDAESELVEVATEICRRILHGELTQADDVVLRMARACVEEAKAEESLVLRVAPADMELLRTHLPELELDLAEGTVQLLPDPSMTPGAVTLETPLRCYDGRPQRILQRAREQLAAQEES